MDGLTEHKFCISGSQLSLYNAKMGNMRRMGTFYYKGRKTLCMKGVGGGFHWDGGAGEGRETGMVWEDICDCFVYCIAWQGKRRPGKERLEGGRRLLVHFFEKNRGLRDKKDGIDGYVLCV
ncbi:hypothetical protein ACMFMG_009273 [Clarireedia jacksonii]